MVDAIEIIKENSNVIIVILTIISIVLSVILHNRKSTIISDYKRFFLRTTYFDSPFILSMAVLSFVFSYPFKEFIWPSLLIQSIIILVGLLIIPYMPGEGPKEVIATALTYMVYVMIIVMVVGVYLFQMVYVVSIMVSYSSNVSNINNNSNIMSGLIYGLPYLITQSLFVFSTLYDFYDDYIKYRPDIVVNIYLKNYRKPIYGRLIDNSRERVLLEVDDGHLVMIYEDSIAYLKVRDTEEEEESSVNEEDKQEVTKNARMGRV